MKPSGLCVATELLWRVRGRLGRNIGGVDDLSCRNRAGKEKPFRLIAAVLSQERELSMVFNALGDDLQSEAMRHGYDGSCYRGVILIAR